MGTRKRSSTQWMLETLSSGDGALNNTFPPEFICGLRAAMETGLSCEQLTAMLVLFAGIYEAGEELSGTELIERAMFLASTMRADIDYCVGVREERKKRRQVNLEKKVLIKREKKRRKT